MDRRIIMPEYGWITLGDGREVYRRLDYGRPPARSDLPFPMIVSDEMDPVQSQLDGKFYTSKSALRATYKPSGNAEGKEYAEVGNDPARLKPRQKAKPDRKAIRDTIDKSLARYQRGERVKRQS